MSAEEFITSVRNGAECFEDVKAVADCDQVLSELATLRSAIAAQAIVIQKRDATVAQQAEALEQARNQMNESKHECGCESICSACDALDVWLAAHPALAQTAAPVTCQCCCGCENIATKEDEHGMHVCEGCYNDYYGIAAGRDKSEAQP